jgi:glycine/D-amino acid oxidase-like deaminating enzyme
MQKIKNPAHWDVLIVGGGIIGSATAYCLMQREPTLKVAVIEPDPTFSRASTTLSLANVRVQFSLKENIQISQYTLRVLKTFNQDTAVEDRTFDVSFKPEGNLFLIDPASELAARRSFELQKQLGCPVEWWTPAEIQTRFPMQICGDWSGATFGSEDGHLDAQAFLNGLRSKAAALGARLIKDEVVEILTESKRVKGVRLGSGSVLFSPRVVNCAGAWASKVALTAGIRLPIEPVKRQVFVFDPADKPGRPLPLIFLPSGLYFRSETGGWIVIGKSLNEDPVGFDFTWSEKRFLEVIWPELAEAVPSFERLKLIRGWAGLYAVNRLDANAILGEWPELRGFFLANGFSGHGLQQAPAVGRYISELITESPPVLDLSIFRPERILENRPVGEAGIV